MPLLLLRRLLPVVALISVAIFIREPAIGLNPEQQKLLSWMPYVTLGIAMFLCVNYNRARLFTVSLALIITYYFIQTELQTSLNEFRTFFIYTSLSLLLPLLLFFFLFLQERGLKNRYGVLTISIIPLFFIIAFSIFKMVPEATLLRYLINYFQTYLFESYLLSINATILYSLVFIIGLYRLCKSNDEYFAALISALVFSFITLAYFGLEKISVVMLSFVGLSLIMSLLRGAHDMAYRDDLTGLLGRRALNERLKGLGKRYVLAMADVDHFKNFNDTHGHDIGDEVLKMVARNIATVKGGGTAYRYGGEEFCIVFSGKDIEYSKPYLEEVRKGIETYKMQIRDAEHRTKSKDNAKQKRGRRKKERAGRTVSVTISIGVSAPNEKHVKVDEVLKAADTALYKAKQNGRNCVATM
jgi:diguanylate cyclase (GGDEF)-like protein